MSARLPRMSVTQIRGQLCTLLRDPRKAEAVEITRRGRTIGLLFVGPTAVARGKALIAGPNRSPRRTLRGTVEIHGDLEAALRRIRTRMWRRGGG